MANSYSVGYGRPPRHSQFQKGQSGNPKGRPKGTKNLKTDLEEELQEPIIVTEGERSRRISKQRALVKTLFAKALKGDIRAASTLLTLSMKLMPPEMEVGETDLTQDDQEILALFEERIRQRQIS